MELERWNSPSHVRYLLRNDIAGARYLSVALQSVPGPHRDAWWDRVLLGEDSLDESIPEDGEDLPEGCVPYLPCPIDALLQAIGTLQLQPHDVLVDVGSGIGRAAALAHFLTGAAVLGIEVQRELAVKARRIANEMKRPRLSTVHADADEIIKYLPIGTAYIFYCPFGKKRMAALLRELQEQARIRRIRICCIDMPSLEEPWLRSIGETHHSVNTYESWT